MYRYVLIVTIVCTSSFVSATSIFDAMENGKVGTVRSILQQNPHVINQQNTYGYYPLHYAVIQNKLKIIETLLQNGADINQFAPVIAPDAITSIENVRNEKGKKNLIKNARISLSPLYLAVFQGHLNTCKHLVSHNASLTQKLENGMTLLHMAAAQLHPHIVKWLLDNQRDPNTQDANGMTPLLHALSYDIIFSDGKLSQERVKQSKRMVKVVRTLLEYGADPNIRGDDTHTPLYEAISHSVDPQIIKLLVQNGAQTNISDARQLTPLHMALEVSSKRNIPQERAMRYIKILLKHDADPNARADGNITPLHMAVLSRNMDMVRVLLRYGANPEIKTHVSIAQFAPIPEGQSAIDMAEEEGYTEIAHLLKRHT